MIFVFDRTVGDVMYAVYLRGKPWIQLSPQERTDWEAGLKGCYNVADLDRVEKNTVVIAEELFASGRLAIIVPRGSDWGKTDWPTQGEMERIRQNVIALRAAIQLPDTAPQVPDSLAVMGIYEANTVEEIQFLVWDMLNKSTQSLQRVGTFYAGEGMLI